MQWKRRKAGAIMAEAPFLGPTDQFTDIHARRLLQMLGSENLTIYPWIFSLSDVGEVHAYTRNLNPKTELQSRTQTYRVHITSVAMPICRPAGSVISPHQGSIARFSWMRHLQCDECPIVLKFNK